MILIFDQRRLPRTMSRREWREIDRWRRLANHRIRAENERQTEMIRHMCENLGAFGTAFVVRAAERLVNPPALVGPYQ